MNNIICSSTFADCNPLNEECFEEYCSSTIRAIEVCGILGIENAVIHTGWKEGITKEEYFEMNYKALKPLFPAMEENNVNILIENSTKANMGEQYFFLTGADMKAFIKYVNHPLVHVCWNLGHANIEGHQYEDIMTLGDDLRAILIDSGYKGYFTFEAESTLSFGNAWHLKRRIFDKDTRLFNPTAEMYDANEKLLFEIGKSCLTAYGIYEE